MAHDIMQIAEAVEKRANRYMARAACPKPVNVVSWGEGCGQLVAGLWCGDSRRWAADVQTSAQEVHSDSPDDVGDSPV